MQQLFFLQDSRDLVGDNLMFWAIGGSYTSDIRKAELFSQEEAVRQHQSRTSDIPWPVEYVKARVHTAVDMQYLRHIDQNAQSKGFYKQIPGRYVGNDLLWASRNGADETTDLRAAEVFSNLSAGCIMWPTQEIKKIARPAIRASDASIKEALKGTGIVLQRPKKERRDVFNCHQCGRFIIESKRYEDCANCGADNRP